MQVATQIHPISKGAVWAGRIISGLMALFLLLDGVMKLFKPSFVVEGTTRLGYSESVIIPLGIILTLATVLYLIPKTSVLGAILLTGYLGGAVDSHVRFFEGWFPVFFPVVIGALLWLGLFLRDERIRSLFSLARE